MAESVKIPTILELRQQAEELGIDDVPKFISEQQSFFRDVRAADRLNRLKTLELENAEKDSARRHALALEREKGRDGGGEQNLRRFNVPGPSLPIYTDQDEITSYLVRFERIAKLLTIPDADLAIHLGSLLSGRALDIYTGLSCDITEDYPTLKQALLSGFNRTPDYYRSQFKSLRILPDENYEQFVFRLGRTLRLWIESFEIAEGDFFDFIVLDQLMSILSPDMRTFLKERNCDTLTRAVSLADTYAAAHTSHRRDKVHPVQKRSGNQASPAPDVKNPVKPSPRDFSNIQCHHCKEYGHTRSICPILKGYVIKKEKAFNVQSQFDDATTEDTETVQFNFTDTTPRKYLCNGTVNGQHVSTIWRDTGCSSIIVADEIIPNIDTTNCKTVKVSDYLGNVSNFPVCRVYLKCQFYCGYVDAIRAPLKFCSVLVGNIPGVIDSTNSHTTHTTEIVSAVKTRSKTNSSIHPLKVPSIKGTNIDADRFKQLQLSCTSLKSCREQAASGHITKCKSRSFQFIFQKNLVYRKCIRSNRPNEVDSLALVVPRECRQSVLTTAHESPLAGHFSFRKTEMKIRSDFFWPGMGRDISLFCKSCDACQKMNSKGRVRRVPMVKMPIISEPFYRVSIDLVGKISPPSSDGHTHILTIIDIATSFPEAIPLTNIDSISVAEALLEVFSRVGIPREIHSDLGTQFTSDLMKELHRLLGIHPIFNTPYHPMSTGRIERLHSTLKGVLKKLCVQQPKEWHRYLIPTLFALRELPSDRTGYSAFELVYGRQVRGPLAVLRDLWEDSQLPTDQRTVYQYLLNLKEKLADSSSLAAEQADISSQKYKHYFDLKSQNRSLEPGDEALVLLPDTQNKLLMSWKGPFKVLEKKSRVNYLLSENGTPKLYHINLLKKYYRRASIQHANVFDEQPNYSSPPTPFVFINNCVINSDDFSESEEIVTIDPEDVDPVEEVEIDDSRYPEQKAELFNLIRKFPSVLSNKPGCTDVLTHKIKLNTLTPVRSKSYPVPLHLQDHFKEEVESLVKLEIIRPSNSPYCSPSVMVRKSDNRYRLAIDYRALNAVSEFDAEPAPNLEEELHKFSSAKLYSQLDLCKAYYQLKMDPESIKYTAFATHRGLMEFVRMPFGLVTACSSYMRLMRLLLVDLPNVSFYFDNVLIFSDTWEEHIHAIENVFSRLKQYGLTLKPSKCSFGSSSVEYLGFVIGGGTLKAVPDKLQAIQSVEIPTTKTALRSFLGTCQFYSKFIENFATISAPLSDLLLKGVSEPLKFDEIALESFNLLKSKLVSAPILKLPDKDKIFVVRTDASQIGIGGILLQYHDSSPHPVAYVSRKLLPRERKYSTIERELLGIIFSVNKFKYYLLGAKFILEVDHRPLVFLQKFKGDNPRIMRWALSLQSFDFRIVYIPGKDNVGADMLSRLC